jgi:hypothetical protein
VFEPAGPAHPDRGEHGLEQSGPDRKCVSLIIGVNPVRAFEIDIQAFVEDARPWPESPLAPEVVLEGLLARQSLLKGEWFQRLGMLRSDRVDEHRERAQVVPVAADLDQDGRALGMGDRELGQRAAVGEVGPLDVRIQGPDQVAVDEG